MNKVLMMGRLTKAPDVRTTESGKKVAQYSLAVDRRGAKGDTKADFFSCVVWDKGADFAEKYLRKGTKILIEGRLQNRKYTDKAGQEKTITEIIVDTHEFCESKKADAAPGDFGGEVDGEEISF